MCVCVCVCVYACVLACLFDAMALMYVLRDAYCITKTAGIALQRCNRTEKVQYERQVKSSDFTHKSQVHVFVLVVTTLEGGVVEIRRGVDKQRPHACFFLKQHLPDPRLTLDVRVCVCVCVCVFAHEFDCSGCEEVRCMCL